PTLPEAMLHLRALFADSLHDGGVQPVRQVRPEERDASRPAAYKIESRRQKAEGSKQCFLPTAFLPTAYCLVPYCFLPTAYCLLPTAYYLLIAVPDLLSRLFFAPFDATAPRKLFGIGGGSFFHVTAFVFSDFGKRASA